MQRFQALQQGTPVAKATPNLEIRVQDAPTSYHARFVLPEPQPFVALSKKVMADWDRSQSAIICLLPSLLLSVMVVVSSDRFASHWLDLLHIHRGEAGRVQGSACRNDSGCH